MDKKKIVFIADFFVDQISRGAELANEALLFYLDKDFTIERVKSADLKEVKKDSYYIISNFVYVAEEIKNKLIEYKNYMIYEHDHKYVATRNPFAVPYGKNGIEVNTDGIVPKDKLINLEFYKNANVVLCQTQWHQDQLARNITANLSNIGGSLYTPEMLNIVDDVRKKNNKRDTCAIFCGQYKNSEEAIIYCKTNNIPFALISNVGSPKKFLYILGRHNKFVFFPKIPESCSRLLIEARLLDCKVYTNMNSGIVNEKCWNFDNDEFRDYIKNTMRTEAIDKFRRILNEFR